MTCTSLTERVASFIFFVEHFLALSLLSVKQGKERRSASQRVQTYIGLTKKTSESRLDVKTDDNYDDPLHTESYAGGTFTHVRVIWVVLLVRNGISRLRAVFVSKSELVGRKCWF